MLRSGNPWKPDGKDLIASFKGFRYDQDGLPRKRQKEKEGCTGAGGTILMVGKTAALVARSGCCRRGDGRPAVDDDRPFYERVITV
jgi:hypothetical protein